MSNIDKIIQETEIPEFIIERDNDEQPQSTEARRPNLSRRKRWMLRLLKAICILGLFLLALFAYRTWCYFYRIGVPVSTTSKENIEKLKNPAKNEASEVIMTSDSILGVALDFYAMHGVRAGIEFEEPDTADTSVFLYCRSADHNADGTYLGSLVVNGEKKGTDRTRLGYMAMVGDNFVIGISRSEKVKNYVADNKGCFFRQFILVSDRTIPQHFQLHGKVERRGIGRIGDQIYFIATRHPETLWDFADALREYGFIDAIYITGGYDYCFYRSHDGERHDIGSTEDYPHKKWKGIIPWLVFRKS
jgi:hypothetical protein